MLSGRSLCAPIPPPLGPPWSTPTLLRSLSLWSGTKEATHLAPGRWGCARAPPGKLQVRHPRGPQVRLGRCVVQSGSSAPPGGWQPGHRGGRLETAGRRLGAAGQLPQTATGVSLCANRPQLAVSVTFHLALPATISGRLSGARGQGSPSTKRRGGTIPAPTSQGC